MRPRSPSATVRRLLPDELKLVNHYAAYDANAGQGVTVGVIDSGAHVAGIIAASGNDGVELLRYPARYSHTMTVGALGCDGTFPDDSSVSRQESENPTQIRMGLPSSQIRVWALTPWIWRWPCYPPSRARDTP